MKTTIVKVQTSARSSEANPEILIYAKGRVGMWQGPSPELFKLMGGPLVKKYYHARLRGTLWEVMTEAPAQDW